MDSSKTALVSTVVNFHIYGKTATLFPKGIDYFVLDGTTDMYGMNSLRFIFDKFKNYRYEWLIMGDENLFFYDKDVKQ